MVQFIDQIKFFLKIKSLKKKKKKYVVQFIDQIKFFLKINSLKKKKKKNIELVR